MALGFYFVALRPPLLPEDQRFLGATVGQLETSVPDLGRWLRHVFTVMGGFMAAAGVLTAFMARVVIPQRLPGTGWAIGLAGALTVALMSAMNFALASDFRWLLLIPAAGWLAGFVLYVLRR